MNLHRASIPMEPTGHLRQANFTRRPVLYRVFRIRAPSNVLFHDNPTGVQTKAMSDTEPQHAPARQQPLHVVVHYWGVAILVVGLLGAALIYVFAADDGGTDSAAEIAKGKMYEHNIALMGGKFAVYSVRFNQWLAGLWHGRPLAYTVAVLAVAVALVCFWVARLMAVPVPDEADQEREC